MKIEMTKIGFFLRMTVAGMIGAIFSMAIFCWTYTYDNATPPDTGEPPRVGASRIRELKNALQERLNVCGYYPYTGTEISDACAGEIRRLLIHEPIASTPTVAANHFDIRTKDVNSIAEIHLTDEDENELQLTDEGTLNIVSADLLGTLANNTYFTTVDQAGTGTVDLIKADANDVAVVPDDSQTATNTAPTQSKALVNKKYVDDTVATVATSADAMHDVEGGYNNCDVQGVRRKVYTKYFYGKLDADATTNVAHGENIDKIFSVSVACWNDVDNYYCVYDYTYGQAATRQFLLSWNTTNVVISGVGAHLQGNNYKIKIDYVL